MQVIVYPLWLVIPGTMVLRQLALTGQSYLTCNRLYTVMTLKICLFNPGPSAEIQTCYSSCLINISTYLFHRKPPLAFLIFLIFPHKSDFSMVYLAQGMATAITQLLEGPNPNFDFFFLISNTPNVLWHYPLLSSSTISLTWHQPKPPITSLATAPQSTFLPANSLL